MTTGMGHLLSVCVGHERVSAQFFSFQNPSLLEQEVYVAYCCGDRYLDTTPRNSTDLIHRVGIEGRLYVITQHKGVDVKQGQ